MRATTLALKYRNFVRSMCNDYTFDNRDYLLMGLMSEVGEIADAQKKFVSSGGKLFEQTSIENMTKEGGDVLFYLVGFMATFGITLTDMIEANVQKLVARSAEGSLVDRTKRTTT